MTSLIKNHPSAFAYYLLFAKWNFVFTLINSGPAKTGPAGPLPMPCNCIKLFKSHTILNICSNFFIQRAIGSRNSLLVEVITANTVYRKCLAGGNLPNLVNHLQFAKLKPSKLVVTTDYLLAHVFVC